MTTTTPESEFWGDALETWPKEAVAALGLAADDAAYLTGVGLPTGLGWFLAPVHPAPPDAPVVHRDGLPVLAFDGPVPICLDPGAGGRVVALEGAGHRRVNTGLRQFGAFLMEYESYRRKVSALEETGAQELIDETERRLCELDPEAMAEAESYWPAVVEQMRHGPL